jgi:HTH-type transcriptional regulator/antitoxin MqsA
MECIMCGQDCATEQRENRTVDVGGYSVTLPDVYFHCSACDEKYHTGIQSKNFDKALIEARRRREGLLSGADIRRIRQSVGLSQAQLESALGIGAKTVIRWENNVGIQSKTVDDVLRLIEFDSENLRFLVHIRQAVNARSFETRLSPEDHIAKGELQRAIANGLERANLQYGQDLSAACETIFNAIVEYRQLKIQRLSDDKRLEVVCH